MILEHAGSKSLSSRSLSKWADRLLSLGIATDAIVEAAVNHDLAPEKIKLTLIKICVDLGLEVERGFNQLAEDAYLQEYVSGHFTAPHVLFCCDQFRIRSGFPEQLTASFLYDNGEETVTYKGLETGVTGEELNDLCLRHLKKNGISRSSNIG